MKAKFRAVFKIIYCYCGNLQSGENSHNLFTNKKALPDTIIVLSATTEW